MTHRHFHTSGSCVKRLTSRASEEKPHIETFFNTGHTNGPLKADNVQQRYCATGTLITRVPTSVRLLHKRMCETHFGQSYLSFCHKHMPDTLFRHKLACTSITSARVKYLLSGTARRGTSHVDVNLVSTSKFSSSGHKMAQLETLEHCEGKQLTCRA